MSLRRLGEGIAAAVLIALSPSLSHGQGARSEPPCLPFVPPVPVDHRPAAVESRPEATTPPPEPGAAGAGKAAPPAATPSPPAPSPTVFLPPRELPALPQFSSNRYDAIDARIRDLRSRIRRTEVPSPPSLPATVPSPSAAMLASPNAPAGSAAPGAASPMNASPSPGPMEPAASSPAPSSPAVASVPAMSAVESSSIPGSVTPGASVATLPTAEGSTAQQSIPPQGFSPPEHTTPVPAPAPAPAASPILDHPAHATPSTTLSPKRPHGIGPRPKSPPQASVLAKTEEHTPLIPIEVLRAPVDQLALADNLYAARSYAMALEAYRGVETSAATARIRGWSSFQVANCLRQLGQVAEAEKQYRRVAGDSASGEFGELSKWWLSSLEQKRQLQSRLDAITQALAGTTEGSRDDAGN